MPIEKIIVLEDDAVVRKHLEELLRNHRYDVAAAGTIAAAQDFLARDNFDLMFADVRLPDGQGTDLLKEKLFPRIYPNTRIVALRISTRVMRGDRQLKSISW